jgi:eukaryotic-like serine/threonine-protein kinase
VTTDQNLLFGVLALQLDFIDSQQFAQVCCAWAGGKDKAVGELLVERGWISREDRDQLQRLLERKVERRQGDVRQALSELAGPQIRDVMHGVGDADVEQTLSHLEPLPGFVRVAETVELGQAELSHYTLSRVHDQGGLGRVWLAFDKNLHRSVALKEIRPDRKPSEQSLRRFVREAQVTGQLEHPNIVPVYELASDSQRAYPFYTMRFMHGQSLGDAIDAYHKLRRSGAAAPVQFQRLLQAFTSVCHAMAYAHSRRVIHRDLKPANVMLGSFGEVVVLDWGLAKLLDRPEELPEDEQTIEQPVLGEGVETLPGQLLGTPAYMAPEQALGKLDEIDALTDVYGLGAILYRILTGERPHQGRDSQERMRHAAEDPTPEPRAVNSRIPRALNAVCRKAMSRERLKRYLSAKELAEDVQRYLADEPVSAVPEPWYTRAGRWARRHAQITVAAAVFLVLTVVVATAALVVTNRARHEANLARADEARAKEQALGWLREAERLIDVMATGVSSVLQNVGGAQGLRLRLLNEAASAYERFAEVQVDDPDIRLQAGHAQMRLGDIYRLMQQLEKAVAAFERARTIYTGLVDHPFAKDDPRLDAALCLRKLGDVWLDQGQFDRARQCLAEAQTHLASAKPSPRSRRQDVDLKMSLGWLERECENLEQAEHWLREAEKLADLAAADAETPLADQQEGLAQLALAQSTLGDVLSQSGRHREAIECLRRSLETGEHLVRLAPSHLPYVEELAFAELSLAQALIPLGECVEEDALLQRAAQRFEMLLQQMATYPHLRENRAIAITNRGLLYHQARRNQEARKLLDDAVTEIQRLAAAPEATSKQLELLALVYTIRGRILRDLDLGSESAVDFRKALGLFTDVLLRQDAELPSYQRGVAASGRHYAVQLERIGQPGDAEVEYSTAIRILSGLLERDPQHRQTLDDLALSHEYLGDFYRRQQTPERAGLEYRQAVQLRKRLPEEPEYLARLIRVLLKLEAPDELDQAAALAEKLVGLQPEHVGYQTLKARVALDRQDFGGCIRLVESLPDEDATSAGAERLFMLALARHQRGREGDRARARQDYDQALEQMQRESAGDMAMIELRDEAAKVLEIAAEKPKLE